MSDDDRVIVIGSGPAGAIAALTLVEHGVPVVMLESGLRYPGGLLIRLGGRNIFRLRPSVPLAEGPVSSDNPDTVWYQALVPGGLSNYWTGAVPRFAPEDFTEGGRLDERYRWPVTYEEVIPYYEQVERLMGITGTTKDFPQLPACRVGKVRTLPNAWEEVAARAAEAGHGLVPLPMADVEPSLVTRSGAAFNSYTQIIPRLEGCPHFELRLGAHALGLVVSKGAERVNAVRYMDRTTHREERIMGAAVVLAAGSIASTKLLLDSTSPEFPTGLGDSHGVLGRYLHDHPHGWGVIKTDRAMPRLGHAAYLTRAPYAESPPLSAVQSVIGNGGSSPVRKALTFTPLPATNFGVTMFGTMIPRETDHVTRHASRTDEFGWPSVDIHLRYGEEVAPALDSARERLLAILEAAGCAARFITPLSPPVPGRSVHFAGSVRMHDSSQYGVLDRWNRLHDVENVVVTDSSCFTTGVEKNPVLTSMALSARAAAHLAASLTSGASTTSDQTTDSQRSAV